MYQLKRISTKPGSPMRILVDAPEGDDAGFGQGGTFYFMPAGQDGDTHQVNEAAAAAIMGDSELAGHFECTPAWKPKTAEPAAAVTAPAADGNPDSTPATRKRRKATRAAKVPAEQ